MSAAPRAPHARPARSGISSPQCCPRPRPPSPGACPVALHPGEHVPRPPALCPAARPPDAAGACPAHGPAALQPGGLPSAPAGCRLVAERLRVCRTASLEPPEVTRWPAFRMPGELLTRRSGKRRAQDAWGEQGTGRCFLPQSSSCHRLDTHRPDQGKPERRRGPRRKARKRRAGSSLSGERPASHSLTHSRHFLGYF